MDSTYAIKVENTQWNFVKNVKCWVITVGEPEMNKCKPEVWKKFGTLHDFACHPCAGAMLIFSVSFQF